MANVSNTSSRLSDNLSFEGEFAKRVALSIFLILVEIVAFCGNGLFIFVVCYRKSMQTRTYVFLANVAAVNVGVLIFCIPPSLVTLVKGRWIFGESFCTLNGFFNPFWMSNAIFSLTLLSIHKYLSVARPLHRILTWRKTAAAIFAAWFLSSCIGGLALVTGKVKFQSHAALCAIEHDGSLKDKIDTGLMLVIVYIAPTIICCLCYWRTFHAVRNHQRRVSVNSITNTEDGEVQSQVVGTLFCIFISFIVSWTPFLIYCFILEIEGGVALTKHSQATVYFIGFSNCAQTPSILLIRNARLRRAVKALLCNGKNLIARRFSPKTRGPSLLEDHDDQTERRCSAYFIPGTPPLIRILEGPFDSNNDLRAMGLKRSRPVNHVSQEDLIPGRRRSSLKQFRPGQIDPRRGKKLSFQVDEQGLFGSSSEIQSVDDRCSSPETSF